MSDTYSQGYALFNPAATNAGANTWQSEGIEQSYSRDEHVSSGMFDTRKTRQLHRVARGSRIFQAVFMPAPVFPGFFACRAVC